LKRYSVEVAAVAESDIQDAVLWYGERNPLMADAFRAEAFDAIERAGKSPLGKAADDMGDRRRVLHRFPYSVVYDIDGSVVRILAVTHHRRQPNYWRKG
jgi:plasmid stabilization system protein ParE